MEEENQGRSGIIQAVRLLVHPQMNQLEPIKTRLQVFTSQSILIPFVSVYKAPDISMLPSPSK